MIEYLVIQNLPFGGILTFYLFYLWGLSALSINVYFKVESIRTDIKYKKLGQERAEKFRLEGKYDDFKLTVKEINKFYRYWRVV
jgi:hypothetical protein